MNMESGPVFDWVDSSVFKEIDADFSKTFQENIGGSDLQLTRFGQHGAGDWEADTESKVVSTGKDLERYAHLSDSCQIFCIRQRNSYSRLYITRDLFEELLYAYSVFSRIWDFVLPFSFKTKESDIGHAPFRFRQLESVTLPPSHASLGSFECAYGFRYVELNHRRQAMEDNPDYDPWSVRQSAVYQQYSSAQNKITFILISPSKAARNGLDEAIYRARKHRKSLNAFDLHRILISVLHENWRLYIHCLEKLLRDQSDRVTLTQVQSETEHLSPFADSALNFVDRQRLKRIEDKVLDLVIIFESVYNTLEKLQRQCRIHCLKDSCQDCTCSRTVEELEEQMYEAQMNLRKADVLHKRARSTGQLLSDLLEYRNAQIAHLNEKSLNNLVKESKDENSKMRILTERSTSDAAAVKILTFITLIYLPMTVVASFFSTQLIHVDDRGRISIITEAWWFAVVSIPLTIVTFMVWRYWLYYTIKEQERKMSAEQETEKPAPGQLSWSEIGRSGSTGWLARYFPASRNRHRFDFPDAGP